MKKLFTFIIVATIATTTTFAQDITNTLGTNGTFIINSTDGGILIPRMTMAERDLISTTTAGLMIYQTDNTPGFYHYDGTKWGPISGIPVKSINNSVYLGNFAGKNATGGWNEGVGLHALEHVTGTYNVAVGSYALADLLAGTHNTAIGDDAGRHLTTGGYNVLLGHEAGSLLTVKGKNTFIGFNAGKNATAEQNIGVGKEALNTLTTGENNVALTVGSANITTGSNNIVIGKTGTQIATGTADNQMNIGNTIYATGMRSTGVNGVKVGIGDNNKAPNSTLDVGGSLTLSYAAGGDITLNETHYVYSANNGSTVTLPAVAGITGRVYIIKSTAGTVTINSSNSENIDTAGKHTYSLSAAGKYVRLMSNGAAWLIIGQN